MTNYTQANRPLAITTPLGKDTLLLTGIQGDEAISELFLFQVELLAKRETKISFDAILGQSVTVELELHRNALAQNRVEGDLRLALGQELDLKEEQLGNRLVSLNAGQEQRVFAQRGGDRERAVCLCVVRHRRDFFASESL